MSQIEDEVDAEECLKCIKEAKLNSESTQDCYVCHRSRRRSA